jgi:hypothetical protein
MTDPKKTQNEETVHDLTPASEPQSDVTTQELVAVDKPTLGALVPGEVSGEIQASDIKLPTLRIVQKMSANPQKLDLGTITVNNDTVVEDANGEVIFTLVSIQKKYEEVLPYGAGIPQRFDKLEEAIQAGFKLCRSKADRDSGVPLVEETAIALLACHQPEGAMDRSFPFDLAGTRVIPAIWFLRSYAYGAVAKTIFSKLALDLRDTNKLEVQWKLRAEPRKNSYGEFFVPVVTLNEGTNTPEFAEAAKKQLSFA